MREQAHCREAKRAHSCTNSVIRRAHPPFMVHRRRTRFMQTDGIGLDDVPLSTSQVIDSDR
jgi:hypothetical protein